MPILFFGLLLARNLSQKEHKNGHHKDELLLSGQNPMSKHISIEIARLIFEIKLSSFWRTDVNSSHFEVSTAKVDKHN